MDFLVVDDEEEILETFEFFIEIAGHESKVFTSPLDALKYEGRFDVIITDHNMAGIKGFEFLTRCKLKWPDTIRVLISGDKDLLDETEKGDVVHKLYSKPFEIEKLLTEIVSISQMKAV